MEQKLRRRILTAGAGALFFRQTMTCLGQPDNSANLRKGKFSRHNLLIVQVATIFFSIGPGKQAKEGGRIPPQVKSGDRVLFAKYSGSEVKIDGVEDIIMREDDIFGILSK